MSRIVTITIIRHSKSIANEYYDKFGKWAKDEIYRNAVLSDKGIQDIKLLKSNIVNYIHHNIGDPDYILISPLKRAIQTGLLILEDVYIPHNKIWITPIVTEIGNLIENKGVLIENTINDNDITSLKKFKLISFHNNPETFFFYNNGWKTKFMDGWELDDSKITNIQNIDSWINLDDGLNILSDAEKRKIAFFDMISNIKFSGKNILIFSHYVFIKSILGIETSNLGAYTFTFNQDTKEINLINNFEPKDYKKKYKLKTS
ncbi:hypothetical protein Catovirus_1_856 [Catovirus CTV1]|uniref:Uncharacterized protein n=1 Tax=Catovirus CTV1 TaxID=1977631 RepID=A0A1V0SAT1_9VIRU|nr:hypothetical protein Catovirus_1_856 [Catovirus CTV1]